MFSVILIVLAVLFVIALIASSPYVNRRLIYDIFFGETPPIANLKLGTDEWFDAGETMGNLFIADQGTGKTAMLCHHLSESFYKYTDRAIIVFDKGGPTTNELIKQLASATWEEWERNKHRIVYIELGHPEYVVPLPSFSHLYRIPYTSQVRQVADDWNRLSALEGAPILANVLLTALVPALFTVLTCIGETEWDIGQVTDLERMVNFPKKYIAPLFRKYEAKIPEYIRDLVTKRLINVPGDEGELRTYALMKILSAVNSPYLAPMLGYNRPGWTPHQAIQNGELVIINGQRLLGAKMELDYAFTFIFTLLMAEINKRSPGEPGYEPLKIVMDEALTFMEDLGMVDLIKKIPSLYRSRKVQFYLVAQGLWQLEKSLREAVWSFGNLIIGGLNRHDDAEEAAEHLGKYNPQMIKDIVATNPHSETHMGQYEVLTHKIMRLRKREFLLRRYWNEAEKDPRTIHVRKTREVHYALREPLESIKESLLKQRAIHISEAIRVINSRRQAEKEETVKTEKV